MCARYCIRPKPAKFAAARIRVVMSSMALGDVETVRRWCGGGKLDVVDVGTLSTSGVGGAVATQVGAVGNTLFCDVNDHAVPFLVDALERHPGFCCTVFVDNPYRFETAALRRLSGARTFQMPAVTPGQLKQCLNAIQKNSRWIPDGVPFDPGKYVVQYKDARAMITDVHFDYVVTGGAFRDVGGGTERDECLTVAEAMEKRKKCAAADAMDYKRVTAMWDGSDLTRIADELDMLSSCDSGHFGDDLCDDVRLTVAQGLLAPREKPGRKFDYFRELTDRAAHNRRRQKVKDGDRGVVWNDHLQGTHR